MRETPGQKYNQSRPINANKPAARAAKAPVSLPNSAGAEPNGPALEVTIADVPVLVEVEEDDGEGLMILDALEDVESDDPAPRPPARVLVLTALEEVRKPPKAVVDDGAPMILRDDVEVPAPILHPSASEC